MRKKVSVFLSVIGADTYGLLKNLITPTKPSEMSYNELKAALLAERFKFQKCNQKEGESVADYIVALRPLSVSREFGQYLSDALRDRFVSGLTSESMQRKLLSQKDLTFRQACEIESSMELASRNTLEIAGKTKDLQSVNAVNEAQLFKGEEKGSLKGEMILKKENTRRENRGKKKAINVTDVLGNILLETAGSRMRSVMFVTKSDTLLEPVEIREQLDRHSMWKQSFVMKEKRMNQSYLVYIQYTQSQMERKELW